MAKTKNKNMKSVSLPDYWKFKHGAYYYRAPARFASVLGCKRGDWIPLGKTLSEAYKRFSELPVHDDNDQVYLIRQLADRYDREHVSKKAPLTQKNYRVSLAKIRESFGHIPITSLKPKHCYDYYNGLNRTKTARHVIEVLRHMYTKAVEWDYLSQHPIKGHVILETHEPRDRYVEDDELIGFREILPKKWRAYVDLKFATGMSKQDLLCIDLADLKKDGIHTKRRKIGRKAKKKVYPWDDEGILESLVQAVRDAHRGHVGSTRLFHTRKGEPYYTVDENGHALSQPEGFNTIWGRFMDKWEAMGNERFNEHDIRAKSASDTNLEHAQLLMGHLNAQTTEKIYRRAPRVVPIVSRKRGPDES